MLFEAIAIPRAVYDELCNYQGKVKGRTFKSVINNYLQRGQIQIYDLSSNDWKLKESMTSAKSGNLIIGDGEAEAIILTIKNNGILASNNLKDVIYYVDKYKLNHITTSDIICELYVRKFIDVNTASQIWKELYFYNNNCFRMPENSFLEYYVKWDKIAC